MDTVAWLECQMTHLVLTGNCYSQLQRDADGNVIGIWPLNSRLTCPIRLPKTNQLAYKTEDGGVSRILAAKDVLHVKDLSQKYDGLF